MRDFLGQRVQTTGESTYTVGDTEFRVDNDQRVTGIALALTNLRVALGTRYKEKEEQDHPYADLTIHALGRSPQDSYHEPDRFLVIENQKVCHETSEMMVSLRAVSKGDNKNNRIGGFCSMADDVTGPEVKSAIFLDMCIPDDFFSELLSGVKRGNVSSAMLAFCASLPEAATLGSHETTFLIPKMKLVPEFVSLDFETTSAEKETENRKEREDLMQRRHDELISSIASLKDFLLMILLAMIAVMALLLWKFA